VSLTRSPVFLGISPRDARYLSMMDWTDEVHFIS